MNSFIHSPQRSSDVVVLTRKMPRNTADLVRVLCILWLGCLSGSTNVKRRAEREGLVTILMAKSRSSFLRPRTIEFCLGCIDPSHGGSLISGIGAAYGPDEYRVLSHLVYGVPNHGALKDGGVLLNKDSLKGQVGLFDRGVVPLVDKVLSAQEAGAVGVIIVDNGSCDPTFDCGTAGSITSGGFSKGDLPEKWRAVKIPAIMVLEAEGARLKNMLNLEHISIPGFGEQWVEKNTK